MTVPAFGPIQQTHNLIIMQRKKCYNFSVLPNNFRIKNRTKIYPSQANIVIYTTKAIFQINPVITTDVTTNVLNKTFTKLDRISKIHGLFNPTASILLVRIQEVVAISEHSIDITVDYKALEAALYKNIETLREMLMRCFVSQITGLTTPLSSPHLYTPRYKQQFPRHNNNLSNPPPQPQSTNTHFSYPRISIYTPHDTHLMGVSCATQNLLEQKVPTTKRHTRYTSSNKRILTREFLFLRFFTTLFFDTIVAIPSPTLNDEINVPIPAEMNPKLAGGAESTGGAEFTGDAGFGGGTHVAYCIGCMRFGGGANCLEGPAALGGDLELWGPTELGGGGVTEDEEPGMLSLVPCSK
ncbi:hypothetical protein GMOD_00002487 [Pyrenophora seminiperda CCB06]|uniref:Uncharacterized protein n=1 Tax=Pyrenophora seminiperda CCB06 TaxID=1302712 RepID=A0A3M7M2J3_9PLEO|nr:hypothetical protein GMOD_00002487 [Pyrenophora seminiperda CCB06]